MGQHRKNSNVYATTTFLKSFSLLKLEKVSRVTRKVCILKMAHRSGAIKTQVWVLYKGARLGMSMRYTWKNPRVFLTIHMSA